MSWLQKIVTLRARGRGCHLVTDELVAALPDLAHYRVGLAHFFLQHTSASLAINENADPDVRVDLERHLGLLAPEHAPHYTHVTEGPDDMPAHIKSALVGVEFSVPVRDGRLALGTWQGLWLLEHRDQGGARRLVLTLQGDLG